MNLYDYIFLSKIHNFSYSEMRCDSTTTGFLEYLQSLGYDTDKQWSNSNEKPISKKPVLSISRDRSNRTVS
jgi:hypothetical protein